MGFGLPKKMCSEQVVCCFRELFFLVRNMDYLASSVLQINPFVGRLAKVPIYLNGKNLSRIGVVSICSIDL